MKVGTCIQVGKTIEGVTPYLMLDEYPNSVLKISTVFSKEPNGYSENTILLKRDSVRTLIVLLQEWLGEPITMEVKVSSKNKSKKQRSSHEPRTD